MATTQSEAKVGAPVASAATNIKVRPKKQDTILDNVLALLSSTKFGVVMLTILLICSVIGMLIMQTVDQDFHKYYAKLTASQQVVYSALDLFDIYHSWYFDLLLSITGLNIILASIDRFPTAWQYVWKPKYKASPAFIHAQVFNTETAMQEPPQQLSERIKSIWHKQGYRTRITDENGRVTVFGQRNSWNRLGAYFVHIALLTIFTGGFLTNRYGVGGQMIVQPGNQSQQFNTLKVTAAGDQTGVATLPFSIECSDIKQQLINESGTLDPGNTVDWFTSVRLLDQNEKLVTSPAVVHLNKPYDYRGYRFFQSSFAARGYARAINVSFVPAAGGQPVEAAISRDAQVDVPGIGKVSYDDFFPDFTVTDGKPDTVPIMGEGNFTPYSNPVAQLKIVGTDGNVKTVFAVNPKMADQFYKQGTGQDSDTLLINGDKTLLNNFEKVGIYHVLTIQYDPGRAPVYVGFTLLILALLSVFLFSHQRIWAVLDSDGGHSKVYFGGNTNRNRPAFEGRFNSLVGSIVGERGTKDE
ncbi:MAG TPA: cytochrome c biogenesis protein ResB [Blastocatellia bacterium]